MASERPRLTRDAVLGAAQSIIDAKGLDACTMRAVAGELGVEAMSLYWHVPNKDALLDGVVERILAELELDHHRDGDWMAALRNFARSFRGVILRHRNVVPLLVARPLPAYRAAGRLAEEGIQALEEAGFERQTAIRAARTLSRYVMGFTLAERPPEGAPPPSDSPALDELLTSVAVDDPGDLFEFGLESLLRGFETWRRPA